MTETSLDSRVHDWIATDPDADDRRELQDLVDAGAWDQLNERFSNRIAFGTAGLRAPMMAGPSGMNRLVVRQSAAGIARYLDQQGDTRDVVIIHDARHRSALFAADCAEVIAAHGRRVVLSDGPLPTPVGVFAVQHLNAAAAVVITASHNPPQDNGLKLFMSDAAQIVPPVDEHVAAQIDAVVADGIILPDGPSAAVATLEPSVVDAYLASVRERYPAPAQAITVAMTAMHGVGGRFLRGLLQDIGHEVHSVAEQQDPDPDFPTVSFPNPEELGATDRLAQRVLDTGAAVGLALDPDADRAAVVVPDGDGVRQLTGDEVGALLGEWLLAEVTSGDDCLVATTVVSSSRLGRIAARHGAHYAETLTGFKWLSRPGLDTPEWTQVLAYEEAIGYAIGDDVHDKDGISAAVGMAALVAALVARGESVPQMLNRLDTLDGAHVTRNFSLRYEGLGWRERRDATVAQLVAAPPDRVGASAVSEVTRLAPDVLRVVLDGGLRVVVRPSGTEPKLKCYCEAVEPVGDGTVEDARARASRRLDDVEAALRDLLGGG